MGRKRVYLASPLGFSPETLGYREKVAQRLESLGLEVIDPWVPPQEVEAIGRALLLTDHEERVREFGCIAARIGARNEEGILRADFLLGVIDGAELDSGTCAEIGFASGAGKRVYALRTDLRDSGEFVGIAVNLQIVRFIERSGGRIFRSIDDIEIG